MKPNVLVSDSLAEAGIDVLREHCHVTVKTGLTEAQLIKEISKYHGLIVRSSTRVTKKIIKAATNLKIIARAGVGVDNIDIDSATGAGIVVINSPRGNTLSAAEHALSLMMAMARNIPAADRSLREGRWDRKSFVGTEMFHKTLGLLGLGKVGSVVAERAVSLGMTVLAYDPFASEELAKRVGVKLVGFTTLLKQADIISLHMPRTQTTYHLLGAKEFRLMKKGVRVVNCARGGLIDEDALFKALNSGKVSQAALDVFEKEPPLDSPLITHPNVIVTPHLGASTTEAQINVAVDVARQINDFFDGVPPKSAINMPSVKPEIIASHKPYFDLAEKIGIMQAQLLEGNVKSIHIVYAGRCAGMETALITRYVLVGFLRPTFNESVNFVNAPVLTQNRGIKLKETMEGRGAKYSDLITVEVVTNTRTRIVAGTLFDSHETRIVMVDDYWMDLIPKGNVLYVRHKDQPGLVGKVGTLLGDRNINIAGMQVGRETIRGRAIMCLTIDDEISDDTLEALKNINGVASVRLLTL